MPISRFLGLPLAALLLQSACTSNNPPSAGPSSASSAPDFTTPYIDSIGTDAIITFDPDGNRDVNIPIRGQGLSDPRTIWYVAVEGVSPLEYGTDYILNVNKSMGASILLKKEYFKPSSDKTSSANVKTGDTLTITLGMAGTAPKSTDDFAARAALDQLPSSQSPGEYAYSSSLRQLLNDISDQKRVISGNTNSSSAQSPTADRLAAATADLDTQVTPADRDKFKAALLRVQEFAASPSAEIPSRAFRCLDTRRFVLYTIDDYRTQYLQNRIAINDIDAFPLSVTETRTLFGEIVDQEYYAVRVSFRNTSNQDRLISTGLIKAYGQARVASKNRKIPSYSIPVEVVPQSCEHVYSMVSDSQPYLGRNLIFRSLEFTGTLATAVTAGFGAPVALLKGVGVFTGVSLPAGETLWPDPVPHYLKNLVDYSMPDLIKVPRNSVVGHKYLFFSKKDLQAMIPDPSNLFADPSASDNQPPNVHVVYVSFDTLDVPFENVAQSTTAPSSK